ncbi:MAG: flippase [Candidatus Thermoplasmatota archaeon]|nr:flippase [Candidatus Thermoplasmatota archaeon]
MIARKTMLIILTQAVNAVLGLIGLFILAKLWGNFAPTSLGIIGFAMSFLGMFNFISDLGFGGAHIKRISEGKDMGKCIGTYITVKLVLVTAMVAVVLGGIFVWKTLLHQDFYDATTESVIYVMLLYYVLMAFASVPLATFGARKEIAKAQVPMISETLFRVPLMILVASAGVVGISVIKPELKDIHPFVWPSFLRGIQDFIASHAVGSLASTYALGAFAMLILGLFFFRGYPISRPDKEYFKSYFAFALPTMLVSAIAVVSTNIDRVMIGYFWSAEDVGFYFSAQKIAFFVLAISTSVGALLFPTISSYHAKNQFSDIRRTVTLALRYASMVVCPIIVFIIVFRKPVIDVALSSAFYPAAPVLVVLLIYVLIVSLSNPYALMVTGMNRPGLAAKAGFIVCVTNIVLNILFIPKNGTLSIFGINGSTGAAIATAISGFIGLIMFMFLSKRLVGIKISKKPLLHMSAACVMGCLLYYLSTLTAFVRWYHLVFFGIIGLVAYLGILYLFKEFTREDLNFFLDTVNPKEMAGYVKSELKRKD